MKNDETTESDENCLYPVWVSSCLAKVCFCFPISTRRSKRDRSKPISFAWTKTANRLQPSDMNGSWNVPTWLLVHSCSMFFCSFLEISTHTVSIESSIFFFVDLKGTSTIFAWKSFKANLVQSCRSTPCASYNRPSWRKQWKATCDLWSAWQVKQDHTNDSTFDSCRILLVSTLFSSSLWWNQRHCRKHWLVMASLVLASLTQEPS